MEEFFSHDVQRLQKGQLAKIHIEEPPSLADDVLGLPSAFYATPVRPSYGNSDDVNENDSSGSDTASSPEIDRHDIRDYRRTEHTVNRSDSKSPELQTRRTPHLEKVAAELHDANKALSDATMAVKRTRDRQEDVRKRLQLVADRADDVQEVMNGEVFQQVSKAKYRQIIGNTALP